MNTNLEAAIQEAMMELDRQMVAETTEVKVQSPPNVNRIVKPGSLKKRKSR